MHFSWHQHIELARTVSMAAHNDQGTALALMGVALTMLLRDLDQLSQSDLALASMPSADRN